MADAEFEIQAQLPKSFTIPTVDISMETYRHVMIAEGTPEVYQGHPTTVLMPDGNTMYCVWTYDHGGVCGPLKRSDDGGLTWSALLPVPENWSEVYNCPSIYRLMDTKRKSRLMVFAARSADQEKNKGTMRQSISEDDGKTWTPYRDLGFTCVMAFCGILSTHKGTRYLGVYHGSGAVFQSYSNDGGVTWGEPRQICRVTDASACEPALVRAPDGSSILCLMRENKRRLNSLMMRSDDEGETWTEPVELPASLTGDRHMPRYSQDGRLVIAFRDMAAESPTKGHFVAWVGTFEDIIEGREGQYRIKLLHQHGDKTWDCGYPGLELLPNGTLVATTYVKYKPGPAKNSVVSVRFRLDELDELAGIIH